MIQELFFELIRVAIGSQDTLSRPPSADEWKLLYDMAKKQSLVGVCFAAVQRLNTSNPSNLSELLYLTWMGMAAKIQQRNEVVNRQCVDLQKQLSADGFESVILKGQGIAQLYDENIRGLRQSGDIDVWLWCEGDFEHRRKKILDYAKRHNPGTKPFFHHIDVEIFQDTEVELHFTPSWMHAPWQERKIQRWFDGFAGIYECRTGIFTPTLDFDLVYLMVHIYRHLFQEGVGLRQVLDYYIVLKNANPKQQEVAIKTLKELGLDRFVSAMMFILSSIFGLDKNNLLCEPNRAAGNFLLDEILRAGNFGHYDERVIGASKSAWHSFVVHNKRNFHFLTEYPTEVIWSWYFKIHHAVTRKRLANYMRK